MMPHPATQILVWICLAFVVQTLQPVLLAVVAVLLLLLAVRVHAKQLFALMRRTRWIFISLLLIYAFATPGDPLWEWAYAPTREGLFDGLMQLGRLVSVLASLAILLSLLSSQQLIGGLYVLVYPSRYLGLSRERIAVRLALTLQYAENAMRDTASDWRSAINSALNPSTETSSSVELIVQRLRRIDVLVLLLCSALLIGIWL